MNELHTIPQGRMAIIDSTGKLHGPYSDDADVQMQLAELEQQGITATAVEIIGATII